MSVPSSSKPVPPVLQQLRLEHKLLLTEKRFLEHTMDSSSDLSVRMTTARHSATSVDCRLFQSYLTALKEGDTATCKSVEDELRQKVVDIRKKAGMLEQLLADVREEVNAILAYSAS